jgi:hypothetical protein
MTPVPPENTPVRVVLPPAMIVGEAAMKLVIVGGGIAGFTVIVAIAVAGVPLAGVTVSV